MSCTAGLQPVLYAPLAMWALQSPDPLYDRSGAARHLTGTPRRVPDLEVGKTAVRGGTVALQQDDAAFRRTAELTITCRLWHDGSAGVSVVLDQSAPGVGTQYNTLITVGVSAGRLFCYRELNGPTGAVSVTHTTLLEAQKWYFATWRRAASGDVTISVDAASHQTFTVTTAVDGSATQLRLGRDAEPGQLMTGGFADVGYWAQRLTDAELGPLYRASMGRSA